ncbi:MAG TPA: AAA family ATPase, partial [Actinomycetota bacterium]
MIVSRSDPEQTEPRLTRPTSPAAVDPRPLISPSFVGREKELDQLTEVLLSRPAIGVVEGEAGVGKTRLVRELLRNHKGLALLGYCHPMREPFPLGPFAEALGGAADAFANVIFSPASGAASRLLPELAHLLPGAPEGGDDPRAERHVLLRSLVALLNDLGPTLLVLEDLHWADDATLELLALLQARFPEGLVLVGTFRREDTSAGSPVRTLSSRLSEGVTGVNIELSPLDITDVRNLVSFMLATDQVS